MCAIPYSPPDQGLPMSRLSAGLPHRQRPGTAGRGLHDMTRLNGKTAVITGGATGIGLASAKRFIEEGAFVFLFGRRQDALDAALAELGPKARAVKGSDFDEADLDRLYA